MIHGNPITLAERKEGRDAPLMSSSNGNHLRALFQRPGSVANLILSRTTDVPLQPPSLLVAMLVLGYLLGRGRRLAKSQRNSSGSSGPVASLLC